MLVKLLVGVAVAASSLGVLPAAPAAVQPGVIAPGTVLETNKPIRSASGQYSLVQQSDGNLVLYKAPNAAVWDTHTTGPGVTTVMQADGNLVTYSADKKPLFNSETGGNPGAILAVQDDGNLVIYAPGGKALWSRHMFVGKLPASWALQSGDIVRSHANRCYLGMQPDGNLVLRVTADNRPLWDSKTAGNPGAKAQMQADGNLVLLSSANKPIWDSKTGRNPGAWLGVQDDCNAVIYAPGPAVPAKALWNTRTHA